jgi:hypothetical protein
MNDLLATQDPGIRDKTKKDCWTMNRNVLYLTVVQTLGG